MVRAGVRNGRTPARRSLLASRLLEDVVRFLDLGAAAGDQFDHWIAFLSGHARNGCSARVRGYPHQCAQRGQFPVGQRRRAAMVEAILVAVLATSPGVGLLVVAPLQQVAAATAHAPVGALHRNRCPLLACPVGDAAAVVAGSAQSLEAPVLPAVHSQVGWIGDVVAALTAAVDPTATVTTGRCGLLVIRHESDPFVRAIRRRRGCARRRRGSSVDRGGRPGRCSRRWRRPPHRWCHRANWRPDRACECGARRCRRRSG